MALMTSQVTLVGDEDGAWGVWALTQILWVAHEGTYGLQ